MRESPGSLSHPELTRSSWPQLFEYVQRCCKLLREVEDTFIDLEGLCPVERRSLPEQSQWVSDMVTASDAEARKTEVKFTGWFDYFKMMSPLIVAGDSCTVLSRLIDGLCVCRKCFCWVCDVTKNPWQV